MAIPKILHVTWKSRELPKDMGRCLAAWERMHPDWQVRFYTDADMRQFMAEHFPDHLALFDGYPRQIQRVDAFRYFVLSAVGGVYSDLDVDPLQPLDPVLEAVECFVGVEPESHSAHGPDGMPYQLCNALMGSAPGHPFWNHVFAVLEKCKGLETLRSAGPRMLNGAGLTMERAGRPAVLAPDYWSPMDFWGRKRPASAGFLKALQEQFTVLGIGEPAVTSHLWNATWTTSFLGRLLVDREKGPGGQWYNLHNRIKWALRGRRYPELKRQADTFPRIEQSYGEQMLQPYGQSELPRVGLAVDCEDIADAQALANALAGLDYPREKLVCVLAGQGAAAFSNKLVRDVASIQVLHMEGDLAQRHNGLAEALAPKVDFCLFVGGGVTDVAPGALRDLLAARRSVVAANSGVDGLTYRYDDRALFRRFYRNGGREGVLGPQTDGGVSSLDAMAYLAIAPLDSVAVDFLLVSSAVFASGVRFDQEPYMLHLDGGGLAIAARQKGFAVCGMPDVHVHLRDGFRV